MENFKIMRKIADIKPIPYGFNVGTIYFAEPSRMEIQYSVDNGLLESRGYQTHFDELNLEWEEGLSFELEESRSLQELADRQRSYHAKRIAHFVVHGWSDPIILDANGKIKDGSHRLKAAIFMGKDEIDVIISDGDSK
jgi:hypothetical protein